MLCVWDVVTGRLAFDPIQSPNNAYVGNLAEFSPDGTKILSRTADCVSAHLRDAHTGRALEPTFKHVWRTV